MQVFIQVTNERSREFTMNTYQRKQFVIQPLPCRSSEIGGWLWALEDTRHRSLNSLKGIEADDLDIVDWVSPINGNSIGTLLYHIAAIEASWLYEDVLAEEFPSDIETLLTWDVRDSQDHLTTIKGIRLDEHLNRFKQVRANLRLTYSNMSLNEFRQLPDYDVTPEWVIHHLMQHESEHRGQITEIRLSAEQALRTKRE
jgi:uncharacterized damage-inducible protein DinB